MKRKEILDGKLRIDCTLKSRKMRPYEGLVGRRAVDGGYYLLYELERYTSDIFLLKREKNEFIQLGAHAVDLSGSQNLKMEITGSTIKFGIGKLPLASVTDTSFHLGYFGGVLKWERIGKFNIPVRVRRI